MSDRKVARSKIFLVALAIVIVSSATAYALWAYFTGPNVHRYDAAIAELTDGKLADQNGNLDISTSFPGLTINDQIYLTRAGDGSFLAMFPTKLGKGVSIFGLLYCSRPLRDDESYFDRLATTLNRRLVDVGSWRHLVLDERLNEHWYRVSRGVD